MRFDFLGARLGALWAARAIGIPTRILHRLLLPGRIGKQFRIGRGSCAIGRSIAIGDRVRIGKGVAIAAESVDIGDDVQIGDNVSIRCRRLVLRRKSRIDAGTVVHGLLSPNSALDLGEHAWIQADCRVNTDERVRIGARSALGAHTMIYSHGSYLPITHGYPATMAPVDIGADALIATHAFVLPGVQVGDGATVSAFSLVISDVPAHSLVAGVPARTVLNAETFRRRFDEEGMQTLVSRIVREAIEYTVGGFRPATLFFPDPRERSETRPGLWTLRGNGGAAQIVIEHEITGAVPLAPKSGDMLIVTIGGGQNMAAGVNWIDPVSLRSSLSPDLSVLLGDFIGNLSIHGIRFGWTPQDDPHSPEFAPVHPHAR